MAELAQIMAALLGQSQLLLDMIERIQELGQRNAEDRASERLDEFEDSFARAGALQEAIETEDGNVSSRRRSSMDDKSHAQMKHGEYEELRSKEGSDIDIDASEVDKTFQSKNAQNHEDHMGDLETAFSVNDIDGWCDYSTKQENAVKVAVMQKVMIEDFKRERKKDAGGMYLAVRDAYHKTNSTLTRKDLKVNSV